MVVYYMKLFINVMKLNKARPVDFRRKTEVKSKALFFLDYWGTLIHLFKTEIHNKKLIIARKQKKKIQKK